MPAATGRSPSSPGRLRHLGRARDGIEPHQPFDPGKPASPTFIPDMPPGSGPMACHATRVWWLALKQISRPVARRASRISRVLSGRLSQLQNPAQETPRTSQRRLTGRMWRGPALEPNLIFSRMIARTGGAISLKCVRKKLWPTFEACHFSRRVIFRMQPDHRISARISGADALRQAAAPRYWPDLPASSRSRTNLRLA